MSNKFLGSDANVANPGTTLRTAAHCRGDTSDKKRTGTIMSFNQMHQDVNQGLSPKKEKEEGKG